MEFFDYMLVGLIVGFGLAGFLLYLSDQFDEYDEHENVGNCAGCPDHLERRKHDLPVDFPCRRQGDKVEE